MTRTFSDEQMRALMPTTKSYTAVVLKAGPRRHDDGADALIWEHGRRNFSLRADGVLAIVCPINDGTDLHGIGIFNATGEETTSIMDGDPAVKAGIFVYEVHPCRSFPGDALPA